MACARCKSVIAQWHLFRSKTARESAGTAMDSAELPPSQACSEAPIDITEQEFVALTTLYIVGKPSYISARPFRTRTPTDISLNLL